MWVEINGGAQCQEDKRGVRCDVAGRMWRDNSDLWGRDVEWMRGPIGHLL